MRASLLASWSPIMAWISFDGSQNPDTAVYLAMPELRDYLASIRKPPPKPDPRSNCGQCAGCARTFGNETQHWIESQSTSVKRRFMVATPMAKHRRLPWKDSGTLKFEALGHAPLERLEAQAPLEGLERLEVPVVKTESQPKVPVVKTESQPEVPVVKTESQPEVPATAEYERMLSWDFKEECRHRGLRIGGSNVFMVNRLRAYDAAMSNSRELYNTTLASDDSDNKGPDSANVDGVTAESLQPPSSAPAEWATHWF